MFINKIKKYKDMSLFNSNTVSASKGCFQQPRASRDRRINTYPKCSGGLESTTLSDAQTTPSALQSIMDDGSIVCGDPVIFPSSKLHYRRLDERPQFQSPAKVFAKLKANVFRNTGGIQTYERDGPVFVTPRKGTESMREPKWMTNETSIFDHNDAEALTISPTKSPQHEVPKSMSNFHSRHRKFSPGKDTRHGLIERNVYTPIRSPGKTELMSHKVTPSRLYKDIVRTPSKRPPQQLSTEFGRRTMTEAVVCLERFPLMSPAKGFAKIMEREQKRTREHCDIPTKKVMDTAHACQPKSHVLNMDGMNDVDVKLSDNESQSLFSADPSESDPCSLEPTISPLVNDVTDDVSPPARCPVAVKDLWLPDASEAFLSKRQNLMSPAKMFTHMKERKRQQQQEAGDFGCNTKELRNAGHRVPSQKRPTPTDSDQEEIDHGTCMDAFVRPPERELPSHRFQSKVAADPSESSRKDAVPFPAPKPQPPLAEDPLILHSPHVLFPKKPRQDPAPSEQTRPQGHGCKLKQWKIKFTQEGLYVDGIRTSDNIPWHSSIIVDRISKSVLKTRSGRTYTLIGKMITDDASKLPKWFLGKFVHGFPVKWQMHVEHFLSHTNARTEALSSSKANPTRCPVPADPTTTYKKPKTTPKTTPFATPACPPPTSTLSSVGMKTSRSGRMLKPPLEFWKGGRVIVDASMNVTILEDYETTVYMTKPTTLDNIVDSQPPKQHGGVVRRTEAPQRSELTGRPAVDPQPSTLQRKVKPVRRNRKAKTHEPPICPPEKAQPLDASSGSSSPEDEEHVPRRTSKKPPAVREAAPQTGRNARRQDAPKCRFVDTGSEGRNAVGDAGRVPKTALPRERNIPATREPAAAHSASSLSDDDGPVSRRKRGVHQSVLDESQSSQSLSMSDSSYTVSRTDKGKVTARKDKGKVTARKDKGKVATRKGKGKVATRKDKVKEMSRPPKPAPVPVCAPAQASRKGDRSTAKRSILQEEDEPWTEAELAKLREAVASFPKHLGCYWVNVAMMVGTRSPEECQMQHAFQGSVKASSKKATAPKKTKESTTDQEPHTITARVGTLKRKQQVRQFIEAMPKEDHGDVFSSTSMQSKRFQMPSMSPGGKEQGFVLSELEPLTPRGASYCTVKTPPCLHITPGMMGSINRNNEDKYIYQLQKRMKRRQVNACNLSPTKKTFPLTPSVKQNMRKCANMDDNSFVIREMFPDNNGVHDDSGEQEDFYFSDSN